LMNGVKNKKRHLAPKSGAKWRRIMQW